MAPKKKKPDVEPLLEHEEALEPVAELPSEDEALEAPLEQEAPEAGGSIRVSALKVTAHTYAARERGVDKEGNPRIFHMGKSVHIPLSELSAADIEFLKADHCLKLEYV